VNIIRAFWKWWTTPAPNKCRTCGSKDLPADAWYCAECTAEEIRQFWGDSNRQPAKRNSWPSRW
jgi:hypothetical protein